MFAVYLLLLTVLTQDCSTQEDDGPYRGKLLGKLNSYHHQVSGEVYAVDEWTILLVNFNYDGTGDDTFFWAGDSGRPGPQGFIVPDQHGKTNILERYYNEDVRLTLPEGKRITRIRWFSIYDIGSQNAFADVFVPDEFEAPAPRTATPLTGSNAVSSLPVKFMDANTILIPSFRYDGSGEEVYFWAGVGPQPSDKGTIVPDEYGYLEPLRPYSVEDVTLRLSGGATLFDIHWVSVYDVRRRRSLGSVLVPSALNVPPALLNVHAFKSSLPRCKQLHRDYQVAWEVFGNQLTIQLAGLIGPHEYMSFGISGSQSGSQMIGSDIAVAYYDEELRRGLATDYNVTEKAPCVPVLGRLQGVCRDSALDGQDSNQLLSAAREGGLTHVSYRRTLQPAEAMDREWVTDRPLYIVWAVGVLDEDKEPAYHRLYHRQDVAIHLGKSADENDCVPFTTSASAPPAPAVWERARLFDSSLRVFRFTLGPSPPRQADGVAAAPRALYVNGQAAPDLQLRRGLSYTFQIQCGMDPHSATHYHPVVVSEAERGGVERLSAVRQAAVRVLAGADVTRRGTRTPAAAGPLCEGRHPPGADPRRDDKFATFRQFNRSLIWSCEPGPAATLAISPNSSWPDRVYYGSYTHPGMGGRIFIVDRHRRNIARGSGISLASGLSLALVVISIAAVSLTHIRC